MNAKTSPRPLPVPSDTTRPFWDGAKKKKLMLQYDPAARAYQFWPRQCSLRSGKRNLEWRETSGKGEIYSFTVTHVPAPGFEGRGPYALGLIDLDEGVRIIGNLVDVDPGEVTIGMRVRVVWEKLSDDITYFAFAPDRARRK